MRILNAADLPSELNIKMISYRLVSTFKDEHHDVEANMRTQVGARKYHTVASGRGEVNALDNALQKALKESGVIDTTPTLTNYSLYAISRELTTEAEVTVTVEYTCKKERWWMSETHYSTSHAAIMSIQNGLAYGVALQRKAI